jgi:Protein of unknown function (DUF5818)
LSTQAQYLQRYPSGSFGSVFATPMGRSVLTEQASEVSMKRVLEQFCLAAAVTLLVMTVGPPVHAQQADQDPSPNAPAKANPAVPQAQQNEAQMPASGEATTRDAKTFTGRILKEDGQIVLKDPVTKVTYKLDDAAKAKQYLGKQVKATGKLDMNTNTIQLERVEPIS